MKDPLEKLRWIAGLTPENCPGGVPMDEQGWRALEKSFLEEGGFTERLYRARQESRRKRP